MARTKQDPCECGREHYARGYCRTHYAAAMRTGTIEPLPSMEGLQCTLDWCDRERYGRQDYCLAHYFQLWRGEQLRPIKARGKSPIDDGYRPCTCCGETKPLSDYYYKNQKAGAYHTAQCKECMRAKQRERLDRKRRGLA